MDASVEPYQILSCKAREQRGYPENLIMERTFRLPRSCRHAFCYPSRPAVITGTKRWGESQILTKKCPHNPPPLQHTHTRTHTHTFLEQTDSIAVPECSVVHAGKKNHCTSSARNQPLALPYLSVFVPACARREAAGEKQGQQNSDANNILHVHFALLLLQERSQDGILITASVK